MKKLFQSGLVAAALLSLAGSVLGQTSLSYNYIVNPLAWGTNNIATNSTTTSFGVTNGTSFNTTNGSIVTTNYYYTSVRNFEEVLVTVGFAMDKANSAGAANTSVFTYALSPSTNIWAFDTVTNSALSFTVPQNGTNQIWFSTNLYVGSGGWFSGFTARNNNTNASMTGFTNYISFKGNRVGQR